MPRVCVARHTRAWIETPLDILHPRIGNGSLATRGRGLKLLFVLHVCSSGGSLATRGRGLKLRFTPF